MGISRSLRAIYNLLRAKGVPTHRNLAIRKTFDEVWTIIKSRYKVPKTK
jgi:hypothetical protein